MIACNADNLSGHDRYRCIPSKNDRVSRLNVLRPVPFDNPEHISAQEYATSGGNGIPTKGIQIVHSVGENEPKAGWAVPVAMPLP